jgi:hypothetical protein
VDASLLDAVGELKSNERTLMFFFAPGYLNDCDGKRGFSVDSASDLVGMRLEAEAEDVPLTIWCDPERVSLLKENKDVRYGWLHMDSGINPTAMRVVDLDSEALGFLHSGAVGFAEKRHSNWTSVFSTAPCLPPEILRAILKRTGVHVYSEDGDVVYANKSMVTIVASSNGRKTIKMPSFGKLVDALDGTVFELDAENTATIEMKRQETRIFWIH